jgi:Ca2+-transporting ATPase
MDDNRDTMHGLTSEEARERLLRDGYNDLPSSARRSLLSIFLDVVREPMFLMLISCGALYLFLGSIEDAVMLLGFVLVIIGISFYQQQKTERALDALKELSSPRALVIRDGRKQRIAGREIVREDIVMVTEGDRVPADAVLLSSGNMSVDESLLTGESVPVRKKRWDGSLSLRSPGGDDLPFIYSGTMVVRGQGIARVLRTGQETEIGGIGRSLQALEPEDTSLQHETRRIVRNISMLSLVLCVLVAAVFGLTRHDLLNGFLAGLTLAMATLPEEFPIVLTVFLALGAWRISRHNVLTRRVPAIEMLGAATVLCVDKTGTLTENRMRIRRVVAEGSCFEIDGMQTGLPEMLHEAVEYSILASPPDPFDPMEKAMRELGEKTLSNTEHLHRDWELAREYPLSEHLLAMAHVWRSTDGGDYVIAAKGAPEAIADLCHFDRNRLAILQESINLLAAGGMRVIGVAKAHFAVQSLPSEVHEFEFEFAGLLGLEDPVRPGVSEALQECASAGIRVIMITGDYPATAQCVATEIGLPLRDNIITGIELDAMSDDELAGRIGQTGIFARVVPGQKLRIVQALKRCNEVVAMTGDGVNDAPALKAAHIGIAMGGRGTDVARESAALVLLDDHFDSIVRAVRAGRRIFDNLKKAMAFILSVHLPIAGMSLLPVLLQWPLALLPAHILFLELIIDPSCTIVFEMEREESGIMNRKPRRLGEPLFGRPVFFRGFIQGTGILLVVLRVYAYMLLSGYGEAEARMLCFTGIVSGNIGLIFANRSWDGHLYRGLLVPNRALWWVTSGTVLFLFIVIGVPFVREMFRFAPFGWQHLPAALLLAAACFLIPDVVKLKRFGKTPLKSFL